MIIMKYLNDTESYPVSFDTISPHIEQIKGDFPIKTDGYILSREGKEDNWDHSGFTTVYREIGGGVQFSNDGSVYVAPPEPEPVLPHMPTLEEVKVAKMKEIAVACEQMIYMGVDVALPAGTEHFSLTEKDQINLFGKQAQMAAGADKLEYHQDGYPCRYYTREEMQQIIETALGFVTYQTTYCNALNMWIRGAEDMDEVDAIIYGSVVPEMYRSEVLKDIYTEEG